MTTYARAALWVRRLGQLAALVTMAGLGIADLSAGFGSYRLAVVQVLTAVATAAVWLPGHPQDSARLPRAALAVAAASLLVTLLVVDARASGVSFGLAEALGLLGVLFVVTRRGRAPAATPAAGATVLALGLLPLRTGAGLPQVTVALALVLAAAAAGGAGLYVRGLEGERTRTLEVLRAQERAAIARDLHDFVAHHVTGIVVQAQGARFVAEHDPGRAVAALEQIEHAGAETMAAVRRIVGVLRDPRSGPDAPLAPLAGVGELGAVVEGFARAGGPVARLHVDGDLAGLPVDVSTSAHRVVLEALTNVRRHAEGATAAEVWLRRTPDWLLVRVSDDGRAQPAALRERGGYGIAGLTERVAALSGRLTAGPGVVGGWVVDAALPLAAATPAPSPSREAGARP